MRLLFEPFGAIDDQWVQIIYFVPYFDGCWVRLLRLRRIILSACWLIVRLGIWAMRLLGVVAGTQGGLSAVDLYLLIYMIMTAGVFAIVMSMRRDGMALEKIDDFAGLSQNIIWALPMRWRF